MPRSRDLLLRLRPGVAPGAAAPAGVPADRLQDQRAEVRPVFAAVAATQSECAELMKRAETTAAAIRERAREEATLILREAAARVPEEESRACTEAAAAPSLVAGPAVDGGVPHDPAPTDRELAALAAGLAEELAGQLAGQLAGEPTEESDGVTCRGPSVGRDAGAAP